MPACPPQQVLDREEEALKVIEEAVAVYRDLGLQSYYEDNWVRMEELDSQGWIDYKLPLLVALTVAKEPISTGGSAALNC